MSIIDKIEQLEAKTTNDKITKTFHGGILRDLDKVTATVDTIEDLRALDSSKLSNGDIIRIRAHN